MTVGAPAMAAPRLSPDPALPGLDAVLSLHPPGTVAADDCRVHHVEWEPRRRCRVVHVVRPPARAATLLAYEVTPSTTAVRGLADDPDLPGLPVALDPARVRHRLAEICRAPVRECRVTPVGYRPATRAVLAYDVLAGAGRSRIYAKLLADGSDRCAAASAAIATSARERGAFPPVPEVAGLWPDLGAVVQWAAPGRDLSAVLRDPALPECERLRYAGGLGRLLADVHGTPPDGRPRWSAEDELAALELLLAPTCHGDPAAGRSLAALVDRLADVLPTDADLVLSHGAFRTGQVVADRGALSLLDLDTVSCSEAARDAGNALAYLSWAEIRGALRPGLAAALREAFLAGYAGARTTLDGHALAWWSAAAMAKIAGRRFRGLATAEWRSVPELLGRAASLVAPAPSAGGPGAPPPVDPLDLDRMTEVVRRQPSVRAAGDVRVVGARLLTEAAGRRRVVRYEVEGLAADGAVPLVGKIYADRHRSSIAYENLRLLTGVFGASPGVGVPAPVCHIPALRMVLYRQVAGTALDRLPAGADIPVARLAARWLATMHASDTVLARRQDIPHELADVEEWAGRVGDAAPDVRAMASALADRLAAAAAELPAVPQVPVHKDFHAGHVIAVRDQPTAAGVPGGIVVLDLDEARMGDPALDVAHLTTYLDASGRPGAQAARDAFLAGYGALSGPAPESRSAFFAACTSLKIAKQLVTGRGPLVATHGAGPTPALTAVLRRGLACLGG